MTAGVEQGFAVAWALPLVSTNKNQVKLWSHGLRDGENSMTPFGYALTRNFDGGEPPADR